jgi:glycogen synthase
MKEEVWVQQPEGFKVPSKEHLALQLQKALYDIKQGSYEWNRTLYHFMQGDLGWKGSSHNHTVFYKWWEDGI